MQTEDFLAELDRMVADRLSRLGRSASAAAARTLEIAEEIQEMVRLKKGIARAPGC